MRRIKLHEKFICIKEYDDETFMRGKNSVTDYFLNKSVTDYFLNKKSILTKRPHTAMYGTEHQYCEIIDVVDPNPSDPNMLTYSMYFPDLDLTDVFKADDIDLEEYFVALSPHVKIWRSLND